ncbi:MAG: hypothetical protein K2H15_07560 [Muribaculaceae bacterium]|nr:hypothetical protein [Muribaculaceae bacterium]
MEKTIEIEEIFRKEAPGYTMLYVEADVENYPSSDALKHQLDTLSENISSRLALPDINKIPAIAATRAAYKRFGKDPNRYRPSQEQLMRRIVKGLGLYYVDSLVDIGNIVSLITGSSLGVFDRDKIEGDTLRLGVGLANEPYEGIGRGPLNIEGLPVIRDAAGGIGTPTSDNERTKVAADTNKISICLNIYDSSEWNAEKAFPLLKSLLENYCKAENINYSVISATE